MGKETNKISGDLFLSEFSYEESYSCDIYLHQVFTGSGPDVVQDCTFQLYEGEATGEPDFVFKGKFSPSKKAFSLSSEAGVINLTALYNNQDCFHDLYGYWKDNTENFLICFRSN